MKRLLLVNPPTPSFVKHPDRAIPSSLLYLGAAAKQAGNEVRILDVHNNSISSGQTGNSEEYIDQEIQRIQEYQPDMVGITCLFSGRFKPAIAIANSIKKQSPNIPIVLGGIHPTMFPRGILKDYPEIDYVCIGEGEKTLVQLAKAHSNGGLENIDGLAYRKNTEIQINPKTGFMSNLDELPFPDYSLISLPEYYFDTSRWHNPKALPINVPIPIVSSRSCPNQCTFCSMFLVHGKKWRARSAENVVDEIEHMYNEYGSRYFSFMDDNFTLSKKRTLEIARGIKQRKLDIQFDTPNGVSIKTLDREAMDALVEAGLVRICVAPESGSEYIRNQQMKKNIPDKTIYDFFEMASSYPDLFIKTFFIVGYPQETRETLAETYEMVRRISGSIDQISLFNLVPFPGTEIFEYCRQRGLLRVPIDNLHSSEIFANYNESDTPFIVPEKLSLQELKDFRERVYGLVKPRKTR